MKKILAINIGNKGFSEEYIRATEVLGVDSDEIRSRDSHFVLDNGVVSFFHKDEQLAPEIYAYAFIRVMGNFSLMTSLIAQFFQAQGVALSDIIYTEHTSNEEKITQMLLFTMAGIPIPATVLFTVDGFEDNKEAITKTVKFPCVLKTNGSKGRNVWKIDTKEMLIQKVGTLTSEMAMVQEFIPNNFDIRALYMHGDIIGAISRSSADGFLNNVSAGGSAEKIELTEEEVVLAKKGCAVLGRSFAGVDIVRTERGPMLFEINLGPQIYGFEGATGIDVPAELLTRIKKKYFS